MDYDLVLFLDVLVSEPRTCHYWDLPKDCHGQDLPTISEVLVNLNLEGYLDNNDVIMIYSYLEDLGITDILSLQMVCYEYNYIKHTQGAESSIMTNNIWAKMS